MARIKRTLAKKPKHTIIPTEDQPYTIPDNWYWITFNTCKAGEDGFFDGDWILSENMDQNGEVRLLQLSDIGIGVFLDKSDKHVSKKTFEQLNCTQLYKGDVMISRMAEPIARSCIVPSFPYTVITAVDVAVLRCDNRIIDNRYVNYLCNTKWFTELAFNLARGTTRVRITRTNLGEMPVPLPPLPEQQRIVDRIERLFAKLDEAKEKAQAVVDGFEDRKAAILHKAFTGELTEEWRKKQTTRVVEWKQATFDDIIVSIKNGTTAKQNKETNNYPVTRIESLQRGTIDFSRLGYIVDPTTISEEDYYRENDIALSHINSAAHVGKTALIRASFLPLVHGMNLLRIRLNSLCIPEFFVWYSRSVEYKEQITQRINMAVNQVSINQKQLRTMPIPIPQIREQEIIVKILNENIYKLEQVKDTAEQVISQIDTMKKAILARAFRGELGTNDPSEPPADISIS